MCTMLFMKDLGQAAANSATALGEELTPRKVARDGGTRSHSAIAVWEKLTPRWVARDEQTKATSDSC
jgi:hypothetical protein